MKTWPYLLAVVAIAALYGLGCAPRYPNDAEHNVESSECMNCHFYGDGSRPPDDHWDGEGNVTYTHETCIGCHAPK